MSRHLETRGGASRLELSRVLALVHSAVERDEILDRLMELAKEALSVQATSLVVLDEQRGKLTYRAATGIKGGAVRTIELSRGEGIAGWVVEHREPVITNDAARDPRHSPAIDRRTRFTTRAIVTVPVVDEGQVVGAVQALNPVGREPFGPPDAALLDTVSVHAAVALRNARLYADGAARAAAAEHLLDLRRVIVGDHPAVRDARAAVARLAVGVGPLLVLGEVGVGKRLLARAVHDRGPHVTRAFVEVDCQRLEGSGTLAPHLAEAGTLYLTHVDAVGEELARVIVDALPQSAGRPRLVAAAAPGIALPAPLEALWTDVLRIPALDERREDIPALLGHYLRCFRGRVEGPVRGFGPDALEHLQTRAWRDNVRELKRIVSLAVRLGERPAIDRLDLAHVLPLAERSRLAAGPATEPVGRARFGSVAPAGIGDAAAGAVPAESRSASPRPAGDVAPAGLPARLRDPDPEERLRACEAAGPQPEMVEPLVERMLSDDDPEVRIAAARALGRSGAAEAASPLLSALGDRILRRAAVGALGELRRREAVPPLLEILTGEASTLIRRAAIRALGQIGDPAATPDLARRLADERLAEAALEALLILGGEEVERILLGLLRPEGPLSLRVVRELGRLRVARAVGPLVDLLGYGGELLDEAIGETLAAIGSPALEPLVDALNDEQKRAPALLALARLGDPRAVVPMTRYLEESDLVRECIEAVGRPAVEPLLSLLPDQEAAVERLLLGIGGLGSDAVPDLVAGLGDPIRGRVCERVLACLSDVAVDPLLASLSAEAVPRRAAALLRVLGEIGSRRATPGVVRSLGDPRPAVQREALVAAARLGDPAVGEPILQLLPTLRLGGRVLTIRVLGAIAVPAFLPTVAAARDAAAWTMRLAALLALGGGTPASREAVSRAMSDPEPVVAAVAARLGEAEGLVDVPGLSRTALDPDVARQTRCGAIRALGVLASREATPALLALLRKPGVEREEILQALATRGVPAVHALVDAGDGAGAAAPAAAVLARLPQVPRPLEPLLAALGRADPAVRAQVGRQLGHDRESLAAMLVGLLAEGMATRTDALFELLELIAEGESDGE